MDNKYEEQSKQLRKSRTKEDNLLNWLDNQKKGDDRLTNSKKNRFINEIKNGLGSEIIKNNNIPKIIKKSFLKRIKEGIIRFFNIFS